MYIAQHRIGRAGKAAPGSTDASAGTLVPDDLATHQPVHALVTSHTQELSRDQRIERQVRFAVSVSDVDAQPAAGCQHPVTLAPDFVQKPEIVLQRQVIAVVGVRNAHVIRRRRDDKLDRFVAQVNHAPRVSAQDYILCRKIFLLALCHGKHVDHLHSTSVSVHFIMGTNVQQQDDFVARFFVTLKRKDNPAIVSARARPKTIKRPA